MFSSSSSCLYYSNSASYFGVGKKHAVMRAITLTPMSKLAGQGLGNSAARLDRMVKLLAMKLTIPIAVARL